MNFRACLRLPTINIISGMAIIAIRQMICASTRRAVARIDLSKILLTISAIILRTRLNSDFF